jgi:predicted nucleic acid-binding protein
LDTGALIALAQRRPDVIADIGDRQIVTSVTAYGEFTRSLLNSAGPTELGGGLLVQERLLGRIVPDTPSARVAALQERGGIGGRDKLIFGTADQLDLQIITGDARFINSAREQGVELNHVLIPPARFTGR